MSQANQKRVLAERGVHNHLHCKQCQTVLFLKIRLKVLSSSADLQGGAEFAGQENDGQICRGWKMRDWKLTDKSALTY